MKTIRYSPVDSDYEGVIVADRIVRLFKRNDVTVIKLSNGEEVETEDSMTTIEARINSEGIRL